MSLRIAKEYERGVVFRLGRLAGKRGPGLYLLFPFIERQILIDQRIVTAAVEKQEAITRDDRRAPGRLPLHSSYRIAYSKSFPDVTLTASLPL